MIRWAIAPRTWLRRTRTRQGARDGQARDHPGPRPHPHPPEVSLAQGSPLVYHRGPGFGDLMRDVTERVKTLYGTTQDVLLMTSSGTGGLESAIQNVFSPGDEVFIPMAGFFADR